MPKSKPTRSRSLLLRSAATALLLAAAVYVLAAHWQTVKISLQTAHGASIGWLALSLLLMAVTFCIAAAIYGMLASRRLRYRQTLLVEVSTAFVNRLLPSGIGGLGLHGVYLFKRGHTVAEATVVVSVNNLIGMAAHLLLLAGVLVLSPDVLSELKVGHGITANWRWLIPVSLVCVIIYALPMVRRKIVSFAGNLLVSVQKITLKNIAKALLLAALLTTTYTFILLCSSRSVGVQLDLLQVFVVFSVGMLAGTATPTPGGLVGAEAGLFAGFMAYGVSSPLAGAIVLLYRLATYWLPLIPGAVALMLARHRRLV